jgi:hypothetical protein
MGNLAMTYETWQVLALLLCGGILYNALVNYIQDQLPNRHGVTAWLVVGGVGWTLVGLLLLTDLRVFLTALLCFMASGTPMILGSMRRYFQGKWT